MGLSVLLVDDSIRFRARVRELCTATPGVARVDEAAGPAAARRLLAAGRPDVVVLDIRMPDGNGIDLLREIRSEPNGPAVVMLTNHAEGPYEAACLEAGADYFLDKASDMARLPEILRALSNGGAAT